MQKLRCFFALFVAVFFSSTVQCQTNDPCGCELLHSITPEEFYAQIRVIVKQELQQDQLLTKEGALKLTGVSNATFLKAISEGVIKPQLIKGRSKAMYLESEVLKIEKKRKRIIS